MSEPINVLPAIALRGTTILPGMIIHFDVSRERSRKAIEASMLQDQKIFLVTQKDPQIEEPGFVQLFQVGTVCIYQTGCKTSGQPAACSCGRHQKGRASWPGAGHTISQSRDGSD